MERLSRLGAPGLLLLAVAGCAGGRAGRNQGQDTAIGNAAPPPNWSSQQPTAPWPNDPFAPRGGYAEGAAPFASNSAGPTFGRGAATNPRAGSVALAMAPRTGPDRPGVLQRPDKPIGRGFASRRSAATSPLDAVEPASASELDALPVAGVQLRGREPLATSDAIPTLPVAMVVAVHPDAGPAVEPERGGPDAAGGPAERVAQSDLPADARFFQDLQPLPVTDGRGSHGLAGGRFTETAMLRDTDTRRTQAEVVEPPPVQAPASMETLPGPVEAPGGGTAEPAPTAEPQPAPEPLPEASPAPGQPGGPLPAASLLAAPPGQGDDSLDALPPAPAVADRRGPARRVSPVPPAVLSAGNDAPRRSKARGLSLAGRRRLAQIAHRAAPAAITLPPVMPPGAIAAAEPPDSASTDPEPRDAATELSPSASPAPTPAEGSQEPAGPEPTQAPSAETTQAPAEAVSSPLPTGPEPTPSAAPVVPGAGKTRAEAAPVPTPTALEPRQAAPAEPATPAPGTEREPQAAASPAQGAPAPTPAAESLPAAAEASGAPSQTLAPAQASAPVPITEPAVTAEHPAAPAAGSASTPVISEPPAAGATTAMPATNRPRPRLTRIPGPGPARQAKPAPLQDPLPGVLFPPSYYGTLAARAQAAAAANPEAAAASEAAQAPRARRWLSLPRLLNRWRGEADPAVAPAAASSSVPPARQAISTWSQPGNVSEHR